MINSKRLLAAGLAASLVLAACGGDDDDTTTTTDASAAGGSSEMSSEMSSETSSEMSSDMSSDMSSAEATGDTADASDITVGLTFDLLGRGDQSFNDSAAAGIDKAIADFGVAVNEVTPTDASARGTDLQLQAENADLVIGVGFSFRDGAIEVAPQNPDVKFAIIDDNMLTFDDPPVPVADNVAGLVFSEEQGSYLVGVAAALKSETGKIGFIGGVSGIGLIEKFEAGYTAGAQSINPDIEVTVAYITEFPEFAGFEDPARAKEIASAMYSEGADIIY
ncbi:MAG: BMP family ABC transporter substrate-binding protein, partial [Ilumatobacter sp.]